MKKLLIIQFVTLLLFSCKKTDTQPKPVNSFSNLVFTPIETCQPLPTSNFDTLNFTNVNEIYPFTNLLTATPVKYWGIYEVTVQNSFPLKKSIKEIFSVGNLSDLKLKEDTVGLPKTGFSLYQGFVSSSYSFIKLETTSGIFNIYKIEDIQKFVGTIDSSDDALFMLYMNNYQLNGSKIKKTGVAYEVITKKSISTCPYIMNEFRFQVSNCGELVEIYQKELYRSSLCID